MFYTLTIQQQQNQSIQVVKHTRSRLQAHTIQRERVDNRTELLMMRHQIKAMTHNLLSTPSVPKYLSF